MLFGFEYVGLGHWCENNPLVPEPPAARAGELGVAAGLGEAAWLSSVGFIGCNDDEQSLSSVCALSSELESSRVI